MVSTVLASTDVTNYFEAIGETLGSQTVEIRARVPGFLNEVLFTEGKPVGKGDPLYSIDDRPLRATLEQTQGALAQADANWEKAKRDTNRFGPLLEKRAISRQQFDDALAAEMAAAAAVQSARASMTNVVLQLEYTRILSPVDGIIGKSEVKAGNLVGQGEPTLLTTISTVDPIHVRFSVSEQEYLKWRRHASGGSSADSVFELVLADGSLHPAKGSLVFGDREVDSRTGTFLLETTFPNPERIVRPGQFARVRVPVGIFAQALLVPQSAVQELQATYSVYVINDQNNAEFRKVEVGPRIGTNFVVRSGLASGERLIVEGLQKLRPGVPVVASITNEVTAAVH